MPILERTTGVARQTWRPASVATLILTLTGCVHGDDATERGCRGSEEKVPARATAIDDAKDQDGELRRVRGAVIVQRRRGGDRSAVRLCTAVTSSRPPDCVEPSLTVVGMRDVTEAFEGGETAGRTSWVESASIGGRIRGDEIWLEPYCTTLSVIEHFEDETGDRLSLNLRGSIGSVDIVDFGSAPGHVDAPLLREYGFFRVLVRTPEATKVLIHHLGLDRVREDARGIRWIRPDELFWAIKVYDGVALSWRAGTRKATDERWRRLDRILSRYIAERES